MIASFSTFNGSVILSAGRVDFCVYFWSLHGIIENRHAITTYNSFVTACDSIMKTLSNYDILHFSKISVINFNF